MKGIIVVVLLVVVGLVLFSKMDSKSDTDKEVVVTESEEMKEEMSEGEKTSALLNDAKYVVRTEDSKVNWAGKKPLVDGYINSGSLAVSAGDISVSSGVATGGFEIDMNTLAVSETKAKPGAESALEGHLKGERWFDVEGFPTATFQISEVAAQEGGDTHNYNVTGDLTMKGQTHELTFPANIYLDSEGLLHAEASFEFDRTKWGITAGSGSFFDDLADNVIDDMVALSFSLVAEKE